MVLRGQKRPFFAILAKISLKPVFWRFWGFSAILGAILRRGNPEILEIGEKGENRHFGGFWGVSGGDPGGTQGGPIYPPQGGLSGGGKKVPILSRLGELLNTLQNVHPRGPGGPPGTPPLGGPPEPVRDIPPPSVPHPQGGGTDGWASGVWVPSNSPSSTCPTFRSARSLSVSSDGGWVPAPPPPTIRGDSPDNVISLRWC